jgi:replicative DNA helicase
MYELLLINIILNTKKLIPIDKKYLLLMRAEYEFICNHVAMYGVVCDKTTFVVEFRDFDFVEVNESLEYVLYKIKEAYTFSEVSSLLEKNSDKIKQDSIQASEFLKDKLSELLNEVKPKHREDVDIVRNSRERALLYQERLQNSGLMGITTGVVELDNILHGWLNEDLVTIFARTNEGKSWIALFFSVMAWAVGKRVLFYSGEMSKEVVGYRFDTLYKHYSNTALMQGLKTLGDDNTVDDYLAYIDDLSQKDGFIVITPRDLGDKPTVRDIENLCDEFKPDLICIDQLTLMRDMRNGENKRIRYNNISEDLFGLSEKLQKPILAVTQARRDSGKKKEERDLPPELDEIYESDGIAQNSTRVISMKVTGRILKLAIKKNRYGEKEKEVYMIWDKDRGILKPFIEDGEQQSSLSEEYGF